MRWLLTVAALLGLCANAELAKAGPMVDQSFQGPGNLGISFGAGQVAQTFRVGLAGNLVEIDVTLGLSGFHPGNLLFDIVNAPGDVLPASNAPVLASGSIPLASIPASFGPVSLTGFSIPVSVGEQMGIVLASDGATSPEALFKTNGTYPNGEGFSRSTSPANQTWTDDGGDYLFQTFVDSGSATPEPSTLTLLGIGCLTLWRFRRRR